MFPRMVLETERLILRPLVMQDLDDLYALYSRLELMQYITGRPRTFQETQERLLHHMADHQRCGFGLCATLDKTTGKMIGRCGMEPVVGAAGMEGDIAWMFLQAFWGRGLATEVARALIHHGLEVLCLSRIFATADLRNVASIRVMEKVGMRWLRSTPDEVEYEIRPEAVLGEGGAPL